jgi:hypothetical protein
MRLSAASRGLLLSRKRARSAPFARDFAGVTPPPPADSPRKNNFAPDLLRRRFDGLREAQNARIGRH